MTRKFTTYLLICSAWFSLASCDDDEVSAPPQSSFTQDKTSVLTGDEVTFVVDEVDADAIALLPYGQAEGGRAGVLIPKSAFTNGKATITYSYSQIGSFQPVVVTSNFTNNGKAVERTYSAASSMTVSSSDKEISAFTFENSTKTTIDQDAKTIVVEMPYATSKGVHIDISSLKAKFSASPFTTVTVGGAAQTSEATANNFTSPVVYRVTAANGTTTDYTVTVDQKTVETSPTFESFAGKSVDKAFDKGLDLQGYVNNGATGYVVILAPNGQDPEILDSVRVSYNTAGDFGILRYTTATDTLKQDSLLNLSSSKTVTVEAQDHSTKGYTIYATVAPKLELTLTNINPTASATSGDDFNITLKVLKGTNVADLAVTSLVTPATGVTGIKVVPVDDDDTNDTPVTFTSGDHVDFTTPVKFIVTVNNATLGKTYDVVYTATVVVLE